MKSKPEPKTKLLTISQAADRLGCHPSTVRRYILSGRIKALQYAKHGTIRIESAEVERFLDGAIYQERLK
jgi:excisionase family DNA binding protein